MVESKASSYVNLNILYQQTIIENKNIFLSFFHKNNYKLFSLKPMIACNLHKLELYLLFIYIFPVYNIFLDAKFFRKEGHKAGKKYQKYLYS